VHDIMHVYYLLQTPKSSKVLQKVRKLNRCVQCSNWCLFYVQPYPETIVLSAHDFFFERHCEKGITRIKLREKHQEKEIRKVGEGSNKKVG
jgi:hypothetical protein